MKNIFENQIGPSAGIEPLDLQLYSPVSNHSCLHHTMAEWVAITYLTVV